MQIREMKKVLVLGQGGLPTDNDDKFDCEEIQSCMALREEGLEVVLLTNACTELVMSNALDVPVYRLPLLETFVDEVLEKEAPDAVFAPFLKSAGWILLQELSESGYWHEKGVTVLGDYQPDSFSYNQVRNIVADAGLQQAAAFRVTSVEDATEKAEELGVFPLIMRSEAGGVTVIKTAKELSSTVMLALQKSATHAVIIEECLAGWRELDVGILRDSHGFSKVVYSEEQIMPVGIHCHDSISVSPIQTLTERQKKEVSDLALQVANKLESYSGYCAIRVAMAPDADRLLVLGVDVELARSAPQVSLTLGNSLLNLVTKIALGYSLHDLVVKIKYFGNQKTPLILKVPQFNHASYNGNGDGKLHARSQSIGINVYVGQNFCEALNKARAAGEAACGRSVDRHADRAVLRERLLNPYWDQLNYIFRAMAIGTSVEELADATNIDPLFLVHMKLIVETEEYLRESRLLEISKERLLLLKSCGFSDAMLANLLSNEKLVTKSMVQSRRDLLGITPSVSYFDSTGRSVFNLRKKILVLTAAGCDSKSTLQLPAYLLVKEARRMGFEIILATDNVSAASFWLAYADRVYIEPLRWEYIGEIYRREYPGGIFIEGDPAVPSNLEKYFAEEGAPIVKVPIELTSKVISTNGN